MKETQPQLLVVEPNEVFYVECSVPAGMTLDEYRRSRPRQVTRWERLKQLAGGYAATYGHPQSAVAL